MERLSQNEWVVLDNRRKYDFMTFAEGFKRRKMKGRVCTFPQVLIMSDSGSEI